MRKIKKMLAFGLSVLMLAGSLVMPNSKVSAQEQTSNIAVHKQVYTNKAESHETIVTDMRFVNDNLLLGGKSVNLIWHRIINLL